MSELDEMAAKTAKLTQSEPTRAVTLYNTLLAGREGRQGVEWDTREWIWPIWTG